LTFKLILEEWRRRYFQNFWVISAQTRELCTARQSHYQLDIEGGQNLLGAITNKIYNVT
jgi:hypothetical protein